ncbi:hypothetical protein G3I60_34590 [Streptomyces sp. SID13666]|uniref:hypothetical protein n=1 Tax=Streptomyces TaxID=1883 RepID=UPI0011061873|nr:MULTISPECIES: hypothetical protein [Streptomyces]MCZ4099331.1 hypothetical protein [Streptomyces sp. H39-C1]NEA59152.1 hypothetical protein [Streptomyces sp. SID13666]NEA75329.1 hypothetical protein [Streptomyces sp. SID13588]QNA71604.1 hypothetical protein C8250_006510 [Streptomyces sp. So13.3]
MGSVALGVWLLTASLGAYLFTIWLRHGGLRQREAGITRLPVSLILGHILLAVVGLAAWTVFLFGDLMASAWAACGVVLVVASLGLMMLFRWLPSPGRHAHAERTAERHFPVTAVVAHGICAVVTVLLVLAVAVHSA